jgi:DnaA family protein
MKTDDSLPVRQVPLAFESDRSCQFDTYWPGANHPQWPHLRQMLSLPQAALPVYLWGAVGSGKTHLLRAAQAEAEARGVQVAWFDADMAMPWVLDDDAQLIVLDDCDRFDAAQQHAAFVMFVEAVSRDLPLLAAGHLPPVDLDVRDDLRSRLGWGLVFQLVPPTEDEMRLLLRRDADRRGIFLSDDVMDFLLRRLARDLSHLMAVLDRIDRYALAAQRAVTVPLVRQMLAAEEQP